jgi:hypothetical protein
VSDEEHELKEKVAALRAWFEELRQRQVDEAFAQQWQTAPPPPPELRPIRGEPPEVFLMPIRPKLSYLAYEEPPSLELRTARYDRIGVRTYQRAKP